MKFSYAGQFNEQSLNNPSGAWYRVSDISLRGKVRESTLDSTVLRMREKLISHTL